MPPIDTVESSAPKAAIFQPSSETYDPDRPPENVFAALNLITLSHVAVLLMRGLGDRFAFAPVAEMPPRPDMTPEKMFVTPAMTPVPS